MPTAGYAVFERLFEPESGDLSADLARRLIGVAFTEEEQERCRVLSEKAQSDTLTSDEREELIEMLTVNDLLMILRAKAEISLRRTPAA